MDRKIKKFITNFEKMTGEERIDFYEKHVKSNEVNGNSEFDFDDYIYTCIQKIDYNNKDLKIYYENLPTITFKNITFITCREKFIQLLPVIKCIKIIITKNEKHKILTEILFEGSKIYDVYMLQFTAQGFCLGNC